MKHASLVHTAFAVAGIALSVGQASAQASYTTFTGSPATTFGSAGSGDIFFGSWEASQFVFGGVTGSTLASIDFAGADVYSNPPPSPLTIVLLSGTATSPGTTVLDTWTEPDNNLAAKIWTLTSNSDPVLTNGATYWLALEVTQYAWEWNNSTLACPTTCGVATSSNEGASWSFTSTATKPAFDVYVNAPAGTLSVVTPEPATMSLVALGLVGMAGMRRRKRSR
jgi:hypothetical protein